MVGNKISLCKDYRLNQYRYNESLLYLNLARTQSYARHDNNVCGALRSKQS